MSSAGGTGGGSLKCVYELISHPTHFLVPKIEFLELGNVFRCFGQGIHFPNQIFCPIEKILIFREMGAEKPALGEKIVATFGKSVKLHNP